MFKDLNISKDFDMVPARGKRSQKTEDEDSMISTSSRKMNTSKSTKSKASAKSNKSKNTKVVSAKKSKVFSFEIFLIFIDFYR